MLKALLLAETPVANPDGQRLPRVRGLLDAYLHKATVHRGEAWHECIAKNDPCLHDGALCIHAPTLREWLMERKGERVERGDLYDDLRASGFEPRSLSHASWRTSRGYWAIPEADAREHFPGLFLDS